MKPHEKKALMDDAVSVLIDACDTDDVYWDTMRVGQDSQEAEDSGYLAGYRDALSAMQALWTHDKPEPLAGYVAQVRDEMRERQHDVEAETDDVHFWTV